MEGNSLKARPQRIYGGVPRKRTQMVAGGSRWKEILQMRAAGAGTAASLENRRRWQQVGADGRKSAESAPSSRLLRRPYKTGADGSRWEQMEGNPPKARRHRDYGEVPTKRAQMVAGGSRWKDFGAFSR